MSTKKSIIKEINEISQVLIETSICDAFNSISVHDVGKKSYINWAKYNDISIALKNVEYDYIYQELRKNSQYNYLLADGNLIQLSYEIEDDIISSHRLAVFPSIHLDCYQNDPELYELDCIYADIISKSIVTFPLRFDYSKEPIPHHPKSHLSLGQFESCRIPVYGPIMPKDFIKFVLKNFYNSFFEERIKTKLDSNNLINYTISDYEQNEMHLFLRRNKNKTP